MVNLTIDGNNIEVPEGTSVLHAARQAGIEIPVLCDHDSLVSYGGCRLCLVELEGARALQPSCTLPAGNKMVVKTNSPRVLEARKFVLTMLFSERNHFCPYCQLSGGDCELQNAALKEGMDHWQLQPNWKPYKVDASHPYYVVDHNRCILCRRCVRGCGELIGNFTLGIEERGANSFLVSDLGVPAGESSCISCGTCVQLCPTGAIIERRSAYQGLIAKDVTHTHSICTGCSIGCGIDVITRDNRLVSIDSDWEAPVNKGILCKIGRFLPLEESRQRITTPLIRQDGDLKPATWEEALTLTSSKLKAAGKDITAAASTRLSAEALWTFKQVFADHFGGKAVTTEGSPTTAATVLAEEGIGTFEGSLGDLQQSDCVVLMGAPLAVDHQVAGFFIKRNLSNGTKLIVIDPADNALSKWADITLKPVDAGLGMVVKGIAAAKSGETLDKFVQNTKISAEAFKTAADLIASAKNPFVVCGPEACHNCLRVAVNFFGPEHILTLKGGANSLAAALFRLDKDMEPGAKAAFIALADEETTPALMTSVEGIPFLAVQASYASELTAKADVVLPVAMWAEDSGSFLNLEGKRQQAVAVMSVPAGVKTNQAALTALASAAQVTLNDQWQAGLTERVTPTRLVI